jgi:hypothetical protein
VVGPLLVCWTSLYFLRRGGNRAAAVLVDGFVETTGIFAISELGNFELVGSAAITCHATENRGAVVWCGPCRR